MSKLVVFLFVQNKLHAHLQMISSKNTRGDHHHGNNENYENHSTNDHNTNYYIGVLKILPVDESSAFCQRLLIALHSNIRSTIARDGTRRRELGEEIRRRPVCVEVSEQRGLTGQAQSRGRTGGGGGGAGGGCEKYTSPPTLSIQHTNY